MSRPSGDTGDTLSAAAREMDAPREACPGPERLAAFYAGEIGEAGSEAVRDHLAACGACVAESGEARRFVDVLRGARPVARTAPTGAWFGAPRQRWVGLAATLALVVVAAWLVLARGERQPSQDAARWRDLVVARAAYTPPGSPGVEGTWRGPDETAASQSKGTLVDAMKPYAADDFGEAERRLREIGPSDPARAEARFYLGVTLLLLDRAPDATAPLEEASSSPDRGFGDEARFYLALAWLKAGKPERAVGSLERLAVSSGRHAAEASRLLARIREAPPR
jgi:hypothetical protein